MIVRNLWLGALMLVLGAGFTWGLAAAMQKRATENTSSYEPSARSATSDKRDDQQWMF
jgi:hypothetical protein